jgi:hypothetical protein
MFLFLFFFLSLFLGYLKLIFKQLLRKDLLVMFFFLKVAGAYKFKDLKSC